MVITKFDTKLGEKFITKSGDHQICHKISHKIWWKIGQQFVNYIQWHISHRIFCSPNLSPYFAPNLVFIHFGDKFITKFGDKFGDHQIWHLIRWQRCHQIWWTPNLSPNNSPNLVTNVSPNWVLTEFVTKFLTKFVTKLHWGHTSLFPFFFGNISFLEILTSGDLISLHHRLACNLPAPAPHFWNISWRIKVPSVLRILEQGLF